MKTVFSWNISLEDSLRVTYVVSDKAKRAENQRTMREGRDERDLMIG